MSIVPFRNVLRLLRHLSVLDDEYNLESCFPQNRRLQESLVELFKIIGKLREPDCFWPWLYGIAINKLRRYYRTEQKHRKIAMSSLTRKLSPKRRQSGFENLVGEELKQIFSRSMNKLKIRYKDVLIMRCCNDMTYSEISESLSSSEVSTRMLFMRAKRALQKELSQNGFREWE
jgi:RNA polymerase sigma-70 factor (ECF subfamily)